MASIYGDQHRKLQDSFDTRKLADRIEEITVKQEFDEDTKGFIETRDSVHHRPHRKTYCFLQRG